MIAGKRNFVVSRDLAVPSTVTMKWTDPSKYAVCGSGVAKILPRSELHYAESVGVPWPRAGIELLLCVVQTRMWAEHKYEAHLIVALFSCLTHSVFARI
jgi:hypothetical protein